MLASNHTIVLASTFGLLGFTITFSYSISKMNKKISDIEKQNNEIIKILKKQSET